MANHIHKQIDELTIKDLNQYPVWVFLSEDDPHAIDECTIKGYKNDWPDSESRYLIKAKFTLSDGTVCFGYVTPEKNLAMSQPVIIIEDQKIHFWHGIIKPLKSEIKKIYNLFNKKPLDIFPVKWIREVEIGNTKTGLINGFGYYRNITDSFNDKEFLLT